METPDCDHPVDWRGAEYALMVTRTRTALERGELPSWLSFAGPDWYGVRLVVDGQPIGPPLAWPNALFIAAWLIEENGDKRALP